MRLTSSRLPLSQEAANPSLLGLCTHISSKNHAMLVPKPDKLWFAGSERHLSRASPSWEYADRLRQFSTSMLYRGLRIKITHFHGVFDVRYWLKSACDWLTSIVHSENWQSGPENHARGVAWLDKIYKHNRTGTINSLAAHKDFGKALPSSVSLQT